MPERSGSPHDIYWRAVTTGFASRHASGSSAGRPPSLVIELRPKPAQSSEVFNAHRDGRAAHPIVVTSSSYANTLAALGSAQKPAGGAPAYSRFINRPLGRRLAAAAFRMGLSPNAVSGISAVFTLGAIALLGILRASIPLGLTVAVLLISGYALDAADGQLARLRGGGSPAGEWLDHILDAVKVSSLHLAVLISMYRSFGFTAGAWLLIPIGFSIVAAVLYFAIILNDQLMRRYAIRSTRSHDTRSLGRSLVVAPTDYGLLCVIFMILGLHHIFLVLYTSMFIGSTIYLGLGSIKWFRELKSLGQGALS